MKKLLIVSLSVAMLSLSSCKKEEIPSTDTKDPILIKVVAVDLDGKETHSHIITQRDY